MLDYYQRQQTFMKKIEPVVNLPRIINANIVKVEPNGYVAELLDYGIHTEANSLDELDFMVNDLIYAYFDVPKVFWGRVRYERIHPVEEVSSTQNKPFPYEKFIASQLIPQFA